MRLKNSAVVWEGISQLDNKTPIVAIATGFNITTNRKLGANVVTAGVFLQEELPIDGTKSGRDSAICGNCPLKPSNLNACYVNLVWTQNPWRAWRNGRLPKLGINHLQHLKDYGKLLRLTSYGDPVAIPLVTFRPLIEAAKSTLGYTHQWRLPIAQEYRGLLQASVHSEVDAALAQAMGWHTYRVKLPGENIASGEILCPNQINPAIQCQDCRRCDGRQSNIVINVHGALYKTQNYTKGAKSHAKNQKTYQEEYSQRR